MGNNWILIVREKYGKTQTFQSYGFLTYFMCGINTYNSQNMRKVNSHSKEKIWENMNISKLRVSGIFCLKQKSMQFPTHGKSGFPLYGKSMEKHKHFKCMGFLNISDEAKSHTTPKIWEKLIPIIREKYGKKANIPKCWVAQIFWVKQKSIQFRNYGKSEFPIVRGNMGKHKHFNVKGFWTFLLEAEIHAVLKIWEKWIAIGREKYGKTETF